MSLEFTPTTPCESIYVHIPFCSKVCPFCSFAVRSDRISMHQEYLDALIRELELSVSNHSGSIKSLKVLYLGGGTPSRLDLEEVKTLINDIRCIWDWDEEIEVTMECNPEDLSLPYLNGLLESGINRISLGGQSFNEKILKRLGRVHDLKKLKNAVEFLKKSPHINWNLDLMFGIPDQSFEMFCADLVEALTAEPTHISLYNLEIHPQTPFAHDDSVKEWYFKHPDLVSSMYMKALEMTETAGLLQYEVSNFARKDRKSASNLGVWNGEPYLGLGCSAHSFDGRKRWANRKSVHIYQETLKKGEAPREFIEEPTRIQRASETLMLSLRRPEGLNLEEWRTRFRLKENEAEEGYLQQLKKEDRVFWEPPFLKLTRMGMLFADAITAELMPSEE